jgi:cupin 2 domain-containing protein
MARSGSLFTDLPDGPLASERLDELVRAGGVRIERIVSTGQATEPGEWLDQAWDDGSSCFPAGRG